MFVRIFFVSFYLKKTNFHCISIERRRDGETVTALPHRLPGRPPNTEAVVFCDLINFIVALNKLGAIKM